MTYAVTIASNYKTPTITPEFQQAFDLLENTRQNVFLTGKAGTGKFTFLHYFRGATQKKIAVVAPTGVAALNVQGQTIHSFFHLKPAFVNVREFKPRRRRIFKELELLIIDEISMVRSDGRHYPPSCAKASCCHLLQNTIKLCISNIRAIFSSINLEIPLF